MKGQEPQNSVKAFNLAPLKFHSSKLFPEIISVHLFSHFLLWYCWWNYQFIIICNIYFCGFVHCAKSAKYRLHEY